MQGKRANPSVKSSNMLLTCSQGIEVEELTDSNTVACDDGMKAVPDYFMAPNTDNKIPKA